MVAVSLLLLSLAAPLMPAHERIADASCVEPAMPIAQLALSYDRWPKPQGGDQNAFEQLQKYMRTQASADHGRAVNSYHFPPGNQDESDDPHIQLALGLLNTTGPELDFDGANGYRHSRSRYNTNAERIGARQLERVLENDSTQWIAAIALTRIAIGSRAEERFKQAEWAVQRVLSHDSTLVAAHLAWHDLQVAQGRYADAVNYMKRVPARCAAVQHARSESIMLMRDTVLGPRMYIEALKSARPDELDRFYEDMLVMASRSQLAEYDALKPEQRPAWLLSFWDRNAAQYGRSLETRIAEHTVRTAFADAHLKRDRVQTVAGAGTTAAPTAFLDDFIADSSQSYPWDIRGVLYVRHGAPLHRMSLKNACNGQELWVYVADSASHVLEFRRECGPHDWKVRRKPVCGTPASDPGLVGKGERIITDFAGDDPTLEVAMQKALTTPLEMEVREMYVVAGRYDPRYAEIVPLCNVGNAAATLQLERLKLAVSLDRQEAVRNLEWNNSAHRQFLYPMRLSMGAYNFRDEDGAAEVALLSWVRLADLPEKGARGSQLRYVYGFIDPQGEPFRAEEVLDVPPQSDATGVAQSAYIWKPGSVTTATVNLQAIVPADSLYGASRTRTIAIPGRTGALSLSDIVVALPAEDGPLVRGEASIAPLPDHNIQQNDAFRLFLELYGLQHDEDYTTVIRIKRTERTGISELRKLFPDRDDERTITTKDKARADSRGIAIHDVDVGGDLIPGRYDVEVRITSGKGTATATTTLIVEKPLQR